MRAFFPWLLLPLLNGNLPPCQVIYSFSRVKLNKCLLPAGKKEEITLQGQEGKNVLCKGLTVFHQALVVHRGLKHSLPAGNFSTRVEKLQPPQGSFPPVGVGHRGRGLRNGTIIIIIISIIITIILYNPHNKA